MISSCKKDDHLTLVLHMPKQIDNTIVLSWEQANVADFQYYMVMRSSDKKKYDVINDIVTPTSDAFRKEITSFEDITYPLGTDTLFYKIMAVGKEIVSSQSLCYRIEHPVRLINGNFSDVHYISETHKISVLSYENYSYKLKTFDLETGQSSSNGAPINLSNTGCWYFWGQYNGKTEFYNYDSNWTISVYDASTLQKVTSLRTPSSIWYDPRVMNNKGNIYVYGWYNLYMMNRATGEEYTYYQPTNRISAERLYCNSKDNQLYAVDYGGRIQTFILDDNGNVTGEEMYSSGYTYYNMLYIENSSLFVVRTNSEIKILDMNTKKLHNTSLTQMPSVILLNNNVIYASDNNSRKLHQLEVGSYTITKSTSVRVVPTKFFIENGYLLFLGQYVNNSYILDKIKL